VPVALLAVAYPLRTPQQTAGPVDSSPRVVSAAALEVSFKAEMLIRLRLLRPMEWAVEAAVPVQAVSTSMEVMEPLVSSPVAAAAAAELPQPVSTMALAATAAMAWSSSLSSWDLRHG
jgi:hypothetical protein